MVWHSSDFMSNLIRPCATREIEIVPLPDDKAPDQRAGGSLANHRRLTHRTVVSSRVLGAGPAATV